MTAEATSTPKKTSAGIEVQRARAELLTTLNAIEDRLNIPKRVLRGAQQLRRDRPVVFASAVTGVIGTVGAIGWLAVSILRRR